MPSRNERVVILGTGGTIAGTAASASEAVGYQAAQLGVERLVAAVPALAGLPLECEQVAQLNSKDMTHAVWQRLVQRCAHHLARDGVVGVVVTHGTDTLEETATFLHRTVAAGKPVVLTAAMRPATAPSPDGPQNLLDAVSLAATPGVHGVLLAFGGAVYAGAEARKLHGYRVDAFSAGDAGPLALWQDGRLRVLRAWPAVDGGAAAALAVPESGWPVVDIVTSHAGARGEALLALVRAGARGIVIAGTGNGSVHHTLLAAARTTQAQGVRVWRASRCVAGGVVLGEGRAADALPTAPGAADATPAQARVRLLLDLLTQP